jgi:hypothetical protein
MSFEESIEALLLPELEKFGFRFGSITSGERETAIFHRQNIDLKFMGVGRLDDGLVQLQIGESVLNYSDLIEKYCPNADANEFRDALGGWNNIGLKPTDDKKVCKLITLTIGIILTELIGTDEEN